MLPHLLHRDAGGKPFGDVLVIGAGSGNDVAAALAGGAVHVDDGRGFLRKTRRKYDLVVYALVDSLVLHSGYSSLRLESFLFTEQALRDVRSVLKPDGVFAMYNHFRQGWVVGRLETMSRTVFGTEPVVISLPYQETITPATSQAKF